MELYIENFQGGKNFCKFVVLFAITLYLLVCKVGPASMSLSMTGHVDTTHCLSFAKTGSINIPYTETTLLVTKFCSIVYAS